MADQPLTPAQLRARIMNPARFTTPQLLNLVRVADFPDDAALASKLLRDGLSVLYKSQGILDVLRLAMEHSDLGRQAESLRDVLEGADLMLTHAGNLIDQADFLIPDGCSCDDQVEEIDTSPSKTDVSGLELLLNLTSDNPEKNNPQE